MRNPSAGKDMLTIASGEGLDLEVIQLDVEDDQSVESAIDI